MGSDDFARKVFEKVFREDIERLRGMEEMWKTRNAPEALRFDKVDTSVDATVSCHDQQVWNLAENFAVFKDRYVLSSRKSPKANPE